VGSAHPLKATGIPAALPRSQRLPRRPAVGRENLASTGPRRLPLSSLGATPHSLSYEWRAIICVMDLVERMADHASTDSWAVWEIDNGALTGEQSFPSATALDDVHGRAVIVALNPGGTESDLANRPRWSNFHASTGHNDIFLAHAFRGTPYWGAYMTDLHPSIWQSDSALVRPESYLVQLAVEDLMEKVNKLAAVETIVCIGGRCYREVSRRANRIERQTGISPDSILRITHYSGSASGKHGNSTSVYRALVHQELGLRES
jgi:hypothetical protein